MTSQQDKLINLRKKDKKISRNVNSSFNLRRNKSKILGNNSNN